MNELEGSVKDWLQDLIQVALAEDIGSGDVTTNAIIDEEKQAKAIWVAKENGILAGMDIAKFVFHSLNKDIHWNPVYEDGDQVQTGETIVEFNGNCRAILTAERTALNIVQRMSGIATKTFDNVHELDRFSTKILDTRKTVPGLRRLDKMAVKTGGGTNHRMGLYDLALLKDNHIQVAGSITTAIERVRSSNPDIKIEVETTNIDQVVEALDAGAEIIMLDNMSLNEMRQAVEKIGDRAQTEASGNITQENICEVASTGVNFISIGALTHSVRAFDISQRVTEIY